MLNRSALYVCSVVSFSIGLIGCQSTSVAKAQLTAAIINTTPIQNNSKITDETTVKNALPTHTDLSITNELLERYNWRLVSAVHNTFDDNRKIISRQPISDFYYPNHPISLEFRNSPDGPYVAFNADCNGSSAPYFLLTDNTFKVSNILSSAINCGETGNRIETALFDFMRNSSSQLTLSLQPKKLESKNQTQFPRYNLLQTMESGETLVWQNEEKPQR